MCEPTVHMQHNRLYLCIYLSLHRSSHATQSALTLHSGRTAASTDDLQKLLVYKGMISTEVNDMKRQLQHVTVRPSKKPAQNSSSSTSTRGAVRLGLGQVVDLGYVDDLGLAQVMSWANVYMVCMLMFACLHGCITLFRVIYNIY